MYFRFLLYAFLIYLLYRVVFYFIIPVVKTTKHVKNQFRDINSRMQENMNQASYTDSSNDMKAENSKNTSSKGKAADYIDFEEVK